MSVIFLSLMDSSNIKPLFPHLDKIVHFFMYFVMTLPFLFLYRTPRFIAISHILMGVTIELVQPYAANRSCEILDMAANTLGVIASVILFKKFWFKYSLVDNCNRA